MSKLTDHDRYWGPITIGRWGKRISIEWSSGDDEDGAARSSLMICAFGLVFRVWMPNIIKPWRVKQEAIGWDEETVKRMGRNWYYQTWPRTYGFALSDMGNGYDFLQVFLGAQTHDRSTTQSWCKHLPWKQWRHVRFSLYDLDGLHYWSKMYSRKDRGMDAFRDQMEFERLCPKAHFEFEDYDGKRIIATTHIEEREWLFGTGWFKWLSIFRKPKIRRSLDLHFSEEVGPEKGSWKGGTTGHSTDMLPGELHESAFRRYCGVEHHGRGRKKYGLKFIGPCGPPPKREPAQDDCGSMQNSAVSAK